jgi:hypothetical protein
VVYKCFGDLIDLMNKVRVIIHSRHKKSWGTGITNHCGASIDPNWRGGASPTNPKFQNSKSIANGWPTLGASQSDLQDTQRGHEQDQDVHTANGRNWRPPGQKKGAPRFEQNKGCSKKAKDQGLARPFAEFLLVLGFEGRQAGRYKTTSNSKYI